MINYDNWMEALEKTNLLIAEMSKNKVLKTEKDMAKLVKEFEEEKAILE